MLNITKEYSSLIKGIAIIMMVIYHLFSGSNIEQCVNLLHIGNEPLAKWISHACGPVPFFLMLSGYGLAYKFEKKELTFAGQSRRVLRIYIHYWIVLLVFLTIGHCLLPELYPRNIKHLVLNLLGYSTSYCSVMWFLLPYVIISLLSRYILRIIDKIGITPALLITACINLCTCYVVSPRGYHILFQFPFLYWPVHALHLLFFFTVGAAMRRTQVKLNRSYPQWAVITATVALVSLAASTSFSVRYMAYAPLLFILLCHIHYPSWLRLILEELGRKSMTIWMIHAWLALYLFQDQFYSLRYPLLIFLAVMLASYLLSIPIMWVAGKINDLIPSGRASAPK